jgi:hypothetical protein
MDVPTALATLDTLERLGVHATVIDSGRLVLDAPRGLVTGSLIEDIRTHRDFIVWTLIGRLIGHYWCPCDACGQSVLLDPRPRRAGKRVWPKCCLTIRCPGRYTDPEGSRK